MKRFGLFLLAVVMAAGLAGCGGGGGDDDADPVGTWAIVYRWSGRPQGSGVLHIYDNETFNTEDGYQGTWYVFRDPYRDDDVITMDCHNGTVFSGTISNDNAMSGRMISISQGVRGTWSATKTSDTP